ncbi:LAFA_0A04940g1_1 [Lachancea sp. 'fantastica']|nr:LAFA_0A04940g1_1 [Lachancea sp. 'fantastica']
MERRDSSSQPPSASASQLSQPRPLVNPLRNVFSSPDRIEQQPSFPAQLTARNTSIIGVLPDDPRLTRSVALEAVQAGTTGKNKRNTFACTNCHAQKAKCVPSDVNDIYGKSCVRCSRRNKHCTFDLSRRTRRRRRDSDQAIELDVCPSGSNSTAMGSITTSKSNSSLPRPAQSLNIPTASSNSGFIADNSSFFSNQLPVTTSPKISSIGSTPTSRPLGLSDEQSGRTSSSLPPPLNINANSFLPTLPDWSRSETHSPPSAKAVTRVSPQYPKVPRLSITPSEAPNSFEELHEELQSLLSSQLENFYSVTESLSRLSDKWSDILENSVGVPLALDPITLGILSKEQAQRRLDLYRYEISNKYRFPFVKIPAEQSLDELREQEPILFVTIMTVVSAMLKGDEFNVEQNMRLDNFTLGLISHHMTRLGAKSLEILKSLLTLCLWYNFPEWSNKTRFHFFNYICCCLIKDLVPSRKPQLFALIQNSKYPTDDEAAAIDEFLLQNECYSRLVILVYVSALNINIFLRQPIQNRWGLLQERASKIMALSDARPISIYEREEDEILLTFAKLNRILEVIHVKLHEAEEDPPDQQEEYASIAQSKLIDTLQQELQDIFQKIPRERTRVLAFYHSVEAYLHEWLFFRYLSKFPDPLMINEIPEVVSQSFHKLTFSCINAMHEFLQLSPELIASLPLFHTSRVIYTVGMLLLRVRYTTITVPAFAYLRETTQPAVSLIKSTSQSLDESARLYPYNNFLSKLRYVVGLFVQIYANKIKAFLTTNKPDLEGIMQSYIDNQSGPIPAQHQNSVPMLLNPVSPPRGNTPDNNSNVTIPANEIAGMDAENACKLMDALSYQLADVTTLENGFNTVLGEFWTDIF